MIGETHLLHCLWC